MHTCMCLYGLTGAQAANPRAIRVVSDEVGFDMILECVNPSSLPLRRGSLSEKSLF
jgi:hypothetical protein